MPSGFLETVNGQWNSVTQHKTFTATGAQVADPNYPPTAQQTLQVWNAAWASWAKNSAQLSPEGKKEYARAYQNYLQVQKTLKEQAAAETWAGQALTSLKSSPKASTQPKAKTKPSTPTPPPQQPTTRQIQQNVENLKAHQNKEADDLLSRQSKERKDAEAKRQKRDAADGAKDARQKLDQQKQKRTNQANYDATINRISQTTDAKINAMHRTFGEAKLTISLEGVPPEQQPQVMQQAAQLYRQNNGKPYNLSNPKDPENDPLMLSQMVEQVRGQGGMANVPVVTKPEGLPKPVQKQGDKKLPTLPIQPKKPDGQQGSFLPQPLPDMKPKSEGEPGKNDPDQVQPTTSKASETTPSQDSSNKPETANKSESTEKKKEAKSKPKSSESSHSKNKLGVELEPPEVQEQLKKVNDLKHWDEPVLINGRRVYQRSDLFDAQKKDERGLTNIERMKKGQPPIGHDGKPVNLHHLTQSEPGSMVEVGGKFHQDNTKTLHGLTEDRRSFRYSKDGKTTDAEKAYNRFRSSYWKQRARDFER
jgi:A nuclease of the HNH/ENDO VII superfamily with conserved LHH